MDRLFVDKAKPVPLRFGTAGCGFIEPDDGSLQLFGPPKLVEVCLQGYPFWR